MKPMILLNLEFPVAFQIRGSRSWFDSFEKIHESSRYKSKSQTGGVNEQFRQGISRTDECGSNTSTPEREGTIFRHCHGCTTSN